MGVKWHELHPGITLLPDSEGAREWTNLLNLEFHEVLIETNAHRISLVFSDLRVGQVSAGEAPFVVPQSGPDGKFPLD